MNLQDWRAFAAQTKTEEGAIVGHDILVSQSLVGDTEFDLQSYLARQFENAARAFYDRDNCTYTYLPPSESPYNPGPFAYRHTPGDLPDGAALFVGRVRVKHTP